MKKAFFTLFFLAILVSVAFPQSNQNPLQQRDVLLSGGLSLGSMQGSTSSLNWSATITYGGSISLDYVLPINFPLSLGIEAGFLTRGGNFAFSNIPIMARAAWHPFLEVRNLNTYLVAKAGLGIGAFSYLGSRDWEFGFGTGCMIGIRYFVSDRIGIFAEAGYTRFFFDRFYAAGYTNIGITFKF